MFCISLVLGLHVVHGVGSNFSFLCLFNAIFSRPPRSFPTCSAFLWTLFCVLHPHMSPCASTWHRLLVTISCPESPSAAMPAREVSLRLLMVQAPFGAGLLSICFWFATPYTFIVDEMAVVGLFEDLTSYLCSIMQLCLVVRFKGIKRKLTCLHLKKGVFRFSKLFLNFFKCAFSVVAVC